MRPHGQLWRASLRRKRASGSGSYFRQVLLIGDAKATEMGTVRHRYLAAWLAGTLEPKRPHEFPRDFGAQGSEAAVFHIESSIEHEENIASRRDDPTDAAVDPEGFRDVVELNECIPIEPGIECDINPQGTHIDIEGIRGQFDHVVFPSCGKEQMGRHAPFDTQVVFLARAIVKLAEAKGRKRG